jgi:hypothetical protein
VPVNGDRLRGRDADSLVFEQHNAQRAHDYSVAGDLVGAVDRARRTLMQ